MSDSPHRVSPGKKIDLSKYDPADTGDFHDRDAAAESTARNLKELRRRQELLYASADKAVLIVIQALDTGGKDGAIKHVFGGVNPQGCNVTSFKQPTHLEAKHDYLWRVHAAAPARGMIGIFNRSHYEDVLVVRVHDLVPKSVWSRRYDQITTFERLLTDEGTTVLKFFLHISKDRAEEAARRAADRPEEELEVRQERPGGAGPLGRLPGAYADACGNVRRMWPPWYIVPSDHKWYRNWSCPTRSSGR